MKATSTSVDLECISGRYPYAVNIAYQARGRLLLSVLCGYTHVYFKRAGLTAAKKAQ